MFSFSNFSFDLASHSPGLNIWRLDYFKESNSKKSLKNPFLISFLDTKVNVFSHSLHLIKINHWNNFWFNIQFYYLVFSSNI